MTKWFFLSLPKNRYLYIARIFFKEAKNKAQQIVGIAMYHYKSFSMIDLHSVVLTDNNSRTYVYENISTKSTYVFLHNRRKSSTYLLILSRFVHWWIMNWIFYSVKQMTTYIILLHKLWFFWKDSFEPEPLMIMISTNGQRREGLLRFFFHFNYFGRDKRWQVGIRTCKQISN